MPQRFKNSEQAETAYYQALQDMDLDAMMNVWQEDEHIVCIHPFADAVLRGYSAVLEGWLHIFARELPVVITPCDVVRMISSDMAVHSGIERITHKTDEVVLGMQSFTHVYRRTLDGWRMILRHASDLSTQTPPDFNIDDDVSGALH